MLYVFHVDVGRMMTFDMRVAMSSVENLKDTIERLHGIPAANIVLLVSGGEMLTQSTQVSCYSAGTDTNPIYMFLTGDTKLTPCVPQSDVEADLREQVERSMELPAVYETVEKRAQLAQRINNMAREEELLCERLVHEQHLQQQGWSAVVANIEDLTNEFKQRFYKFAAAFEQDLEKRGKYLELLDNFGDDLTQLASIPILPGLMSLAEEDFHGFDEFLDTDGVFARSHTQNKSVLMVGGVPAETNTSAAADTAAVSIVSEDAEGECGEDKTPNKKLKMGNDAETDLASTTTTDALVLQSSSGSNKRRHLNLLQWITSKETNNMLKDMCDECIQGLSAFTDEIFDKLKMEFQRIVNLAEQGDVKEIKGLSERLCKLEEFKYKIKNKVKEQKDLATALQQNQKRAKNLCDPSILPDLCVSHRSQLLVMLNNQLKIREFRRLIAKAKDELGCNLNTRLKRIVWIENAMSEFDNMLLFYRRCLRRAERHINIIEQIHKAPCIYVDAVTEVVRRKIFSEEFRQWATKLAEDFNTIHREEIRRRQLFNDSFDGHFLNLLFPGMHDMPPAFANETPLVFDTDLPNLTRSDIDYLTSYMPDLAQQIQLPDLGPVIHFFVSRSGAHQQERLEELLRQQMVVAMSGVGAADKPLLHQRIGELQKEAIVGGGGADGSGCEESETDTETEFEKVLTSTQSVATSTSDNQLHALVETVARSTATDLLLTQSAETITEETEQSTRAEVQRLRAQLDAMSKLSLDCISMARANLTTIRVDTQAYREDLQSELQMLDEKWKMVHMQYAAHEQLMQDANTERNKELHLLRDSLAKQEEHVKQLQQQLQDMEVMQLRCGTLEAQVEELQRQVNAAQLDQNNAVTMAREELIHEHKTEIESLRCRFKLMTSMERTPSDSSLERIERPVSAHDQSTMVDLVQHEAVLAQLRATLINEKEKAVATAIEVERSRSVIADASILKEMLEEKERQLDLMREKDIMLTKENIQLMTRLDALTNDDGNSWLREKIEYLNRDKCRLEEELNMERSRRQDMENSMRTSMYEQSSLPRSKSSGSSHKYVVLESCAKGDVVFVVWSARHAQYMVVQDSQSLYFVHGDSLGALNLRLPTPPAEGTVTAEEMPIPVPYYAIGRVTEKEYCQAKKDENRYRVLKGSKFYRIKLAPLTTKLTRRERLESFSASISRSISQCETHSESSAAAAIAGATSGSAVSNIGPLRPSQSGNANSASAGIVATIAKDVVDFAAASPTNVVATSTCPVISCGNSNTSLVGISAVTGISVAGLSLKERTISMTSVTEEDDEPVSFLIERYVSVSEEEEPLTFGAITQLAVPATMTETATTITSTNLQQSVITEQPTASSKLQMDLMLASADITNQQCDATVATTATTTNIPTANVTPSITASTSTHSSVDGSDHNTCSQPIQQTPPQVVVATANTTATPTLPLMMTDAQILHTCSASIPASICTTSEDSDEYRSLEAKDDTEFPVSE